MINMNDLHGTIVRFNVDTLSLSIYVYIHIDVCVCTFIPRTSLTNILIANNFKLEDLTSLKTSNMLLLFHDFVHRK